MYTDRLEVQYWFVLLGELTDTVVNILQCIATRCVCVCVETRVVLMLKFVDRMVPSKSNGYYMYRQFNIQQFYVLPTQCIYVFCVDLRTNSDYFPIQH